jgi:hypothetical protein
MRARLVILSVIAVAVPVMLVAPAHAAAFLHLAQSPAAPSPSAQAAGPPWTYQMAKIVIFLLVLMALAMSGLYYRLVIKRRRGEI